MGCSEAEALAAAQTVGRLLDAYGLTLTDVELQSTACIEDAVMSPFVTNRHPIRERLLEMKVARDQDLKTTGRDLVSVVGAVVSRAFAQAYPQIHTVGYQERPYNASAYHQGMVVGGRVGLHPGVKNPRHRLCNLRHKPEVQAMNPIDTRRWEERRLAQEASFLMPLLAKEMCVVDGGCEPGSITRDIAAWVAPGWVIGVDTNAERLATTQRLVRQSRLQNVCLQVGEATRLALREETADLVFAHGLVEHLSAPAVAVQAFSRVVKPGGWVALRSPDWGNLLLEPTSPPLLASIELRNRWQRHNQGDPQAGRKLKGLLYRAGLTEITARAEAPHETPSAFRDYISTLLRDPALHALSARYGWSREADIANMIRAWSSWSTPPHAFVASFWCHAMARKPVSPVDPTLEMTGTSRLGGSHHAA